MRLYPRTPTQETKALHAAAHPKREKREFVIPVHNRNFFPRPARLDLVIGCLVNMGARPKCER